MKKAILLMLGAALPLTALAAPDFNGSWVRDNARSDKDSYPLYWLTRGGTEGGGPNANADYVISVRQNGQTLQVTDPVRPLRTYTLDGKPHTVTMDTGIAKASVTAGLQGDALVIGTTQPYGGMPGNATMKVTETWALSPDGRQLTITTVRDLPAAKQTLKAVYSKK